MPARTIALLLSLATAVVAETTYVVDPQARLMALIDKAEEMRVVSELTFPPGLRLTQQVTEKPGTFSLSGVAEQEVKAGRVRLTLRVPRAEFLGGTAEIEGRTTVIAAAKGVAPDIASGTAQSVQLKGPTWRLTLSVETPKPLNVRDVWERRGRYYLVSAELFNGDLAQGESFRSTFSVAGEATPDTRPASLQLDASQVRYKFHGFGGNYCFNTDSPVTQYTLANLRSAWARVEMNSREWEPQNDDESPDTTNWPPLKAHDVEGSKLHRDFLLAQQIQKKSIPYVISAWRLPEWLYSDPQPKPVSNQKRLVPRDKWPELLEHIGSYLSYAKEQYGVEPDLFSFNEANIGVDILFTPEEHREFIKSLGAHMRKLGLKTKMLLGDATGPQGTHEWALAAANDGEALEYVGAVAFHSWGGATPEQYSAWGDLAEWLKLPLLVAEVGVDAWAYRGRAYDSYHYGVREVQMYQELLLHARPQGFMQWEYTGDYGLARTNTKGDGSVEVKPTQRFWFLKQFSELTPMHSDALATQSDHRKVLFTAFAGTEKGRRVHTMHVANLGAEREVTITGIPGEIRTLRTVRTSETDEFKDTGAVTVSGGAVRLRVPERCLVTLTSGD